MVLLGDGLQSGVTEALGPVGEAADGAVKRGGDKKIGAYIYLVNSNGNRT
jgi:hypothetical protein